MIELRKISRSLKGSKNNSVRPGVFSSKESDQQEQKILDAKFNSNDRLQQASDQLIADRKKEEHQSIKDSSMKSVDKPKLIKEE